MIATPDMLSDAPLGEVTATHDALQVVFHRRYGKPIERGWAALTTPERLADWLAQAEIEMRAGGRIRLTWNGAHSMEGRVLVCEPPRAFAWAWELDGRETVVRFGLKPDGGGCWLTLTLSVLRPMHGRGSGLRAGVHAHLVGVADAIEGRATPWAAKTAREAALAGAYPSLPA